MVVVTLIAFRESTPVLFLWRRVVGGSSSVCSNGLLFLWRCLGWGLFVVVIVVVVVGVPEFSFLLILAGFSLWGHRPLSDGLVSQAYRYALGALERLWVEGSNRVLNLGG